MAAIDGQTLANQDAATQALFNAQYGAGAAGQWEAQHNQALQGASPLAAPNDPLAGGTTAAIQNAQNNANQTAINAATQQALAAYQQAEAQHLSVSDAQAAAAQAFDQAMKVVTTVAGLSGPANAFTQQAVLHGLDANGLSNAIDAIQGKMGLPTFEAPQANPQVQSASSVMGSIANGTNLPGFAGAPAVVPTPAVAATPAAGVSALGHGGAAPGMGGAMKNQYPVGSSEWNFFNSMDTHQESQPGTPTGSRTVVTGADGNVGPRNGVSYTPDVVNFAWANSVDPYVIAQYKAQTGQFPTNLAQVSAWLRTAGIGNFDQPGWAGNTNAFQNPNGTPASTPATQTSPAATGGSASNTGTQDPSQMTISQLIAALHQSTPATGAAPVPGQAFPGGSPGGLPTPTNSVGAPATLDPVTAAYVNALPAPNKINGPNFTSLDKDTQDFVKAAYQQAGYSANDVTSAVAAGLPRFKAPSAAPVAASGQITN